MAERLPASRVSVRKSDVSAVSDAITAYETGDHSPKSFTSAVNACKLTMLHTIADTFAAGSMPTKVMRDVAATLHYLGNSAPSKDVSKNTVTSDDAGDF